MTEAKRYGVGSLEEEIRKLGEGTISAPVDDSGTQEVIEEGSDQLEEGVVVSGINMAPTKKNMLRGKANITMNKRGGKLSFKIEYTGAGAESPVTVDVKGLAKRVA